MTFNTFSNGVNTTFSSELNENFSALERSSQPLTTLYVGTDFDTSISGSGTSTSSYVIDLASSTIEDLNYIVISNTQRFAATKDNSNSSCNVNLKLESAYIGGGYSTEYDLSLTSFGGTTTVMMVDSFNTIRWVIALTANMHTNGTRLRFTSTSTTTNAGNSASFTNKQLYITGAL
jgi:hypothetical protein